MKTRTPRKYYEDEDTEDEEENEENLDRFLLNGNHTHAEFVDWLYKLFWDPLCQGGGV